eukprot:TRINITY_DN2243_c2_g1_i1.p1 TRINITY_DN2243_c2_g1~~TRINITY_DN2243_c2_g1_i1.p1  ORF type:complete len:358 (+),score=74.92 TRINITY_DN2243_c2_g1_i1:78-1151(+)
MNTGLTRSYLSSFIKKIVKLNNTPIIKSNYSRLNEGVRKEKVGKEEVKQVGDEEETHFGYKTIRKEEKEKEVAKVFHNVANNYDVMNDLMSLGIHRLWKDDFVNKISSLESPVKILDVAGGTGDIGFRILNTLKHKNKPYSLGSKESNVYNEVVICDINKSMLQVGKERAMKDYNYAVVKNEDFSYQEIDRNNRSTIVIENNDNNNICYNNNNNYLQFVEGNAEKLTAFNDDTFDAYTIAFGIRNCTNIDKVLDEAYRVLKVGGRFLCLEFSHVEGANSNRLLKAFDQFYDHYSFNVIPPLGYLFGDWHSYQYLVESIRKFPNQSKFKSMIEQSGFQNVTYENYNLGIVSIHSAFKF